MIKYLVYVHGIKGPEPQLWFDVYDSQGRLKPHLLSRPLDSWDQRSIEQLKKAYPVEISS